MKIFNWDWKLNDAYDFNRFYLNTVFTTARHPDEKHASNQLITCLKIRDFCFDNAIWLSIETVSFLAIFNVQTILLQFQNFFDNSERFQLIHTAHTSFENTLYSQMKWKTIKNQSRIFFIKIAFANFCELCWNEVKYFCWMWTYFVNSTYIVYYTKSIMINVIIKWIQ